MKPLQSLSHCEEFFALLSTIYHRCFWLRISIYFNFRSDFRKHVRGDEKSPSGHVSALWKNVCVCVFAIYNVHMHICCLYAAPAKGKTRASSARENSIIHHDPISWPFDCSAAHSHWLAGATDYSSQDTIFAGRKD